MSFTRTITPRTVHSSVFNAQQMAYSGQDLAEAAGNYARYNSRSDSEKLAFNDALAATGFTEAFNENFETEYSDQIEQWNSAPLDARGRRRIQASDEMALVEQYMNGVMSHEDMEGIRAANPTHYASMVPLADVEAEGRNISLRAHEEMMRVSYFNTTESPTLRMIQGSITPTMTDPVNVGVMAATLIVGGYGLAAVGTNALRGAVAGAAFEGALGGGAEAFIQKNIREYQRSMGVDYTQEEANEATLFAGLFGAGLGGLAGALGGADIGRTLARSSELSAAEVAVARDQLSQAIKGSPLEAIIDSAEHQVYMNVTNPNYSGVQKMTPTEIMAHEDNLHAAVKSTLELEMPELPVGREQAFGFRSAGQVNDYAAVVRVNEAVAGASDPLAMLGSKQFIDDTITQVVDSNLRARLMSQRAVLAPRRAIQDQVSEIEASIKATNARIDAEGLTPDEVTALKESNAALQVELDQLRNATDGAYTLEDIASTSALLRDAEEAFEAATKATKDTARKQELSQDYKKRVNVIETNQRKAATGYTKISEEGMAKLKAIQSQINKVPDDLIELAKIETALDALNKGDLDALPYEFQRYVADAQRAVESATNTAKTISEAEVNKSVRAIKKLLKEKDRRMAGLKGDPSFTTGRYAKEVDNELANVDSGADIEEVAKLPDDTPTYSADGPSNVGKMREDATDSVSAEVDEVANGVCKVA